MHAEGRGGVSDHLLDASEVAALLNVPVGWVREHTRTKSMPYIELGRYRRYERAEVLAWLEHCRRGGGPAFRKHLPKVEPERTER